MQVSEARAELRERMERITAKLTAGGADRLSDQQQAQLARVLQDSYRYLGTSRLHALFPEDGPFRRELYPRHMEHFAAGKIYKARAFMAGNRIGKGLPLHEPVLTPGGPRQIGDLEVGDNVVGSAGLPVKVLAVYRRGFQRLFRVTMTDGSSVVTDSDHLWRVRTSTGKRKPKPWRLRSTGEMHATGRRYEVPDRPVIAGSSEPPPMDPYLLGCLIGDGGLTNGITLTTMDPGLASRCRSALDGLGCIMTPTGQSGAATTYQIAARTRQTNEKGHPRPSRAAGVLADLGLLGRNSHDKFVPARYLTSGMCSRVELLRGLMDTDGTVDGHGTRTFYSVSHQLAADVAHLARTLGMNASVKLKRGLYLGQRHLSWRVTVFCGGLPVFDLPRKAGREHARWKPQRRLRIKAIEPLAIESETVCIRVDAEDGVFLTGECIPTHNTWAGGYESSAHATGWYPDWWQGWTINRPGEYVVAAKTTKTLKKVIQKTLFGPADRGMKGKFRVRGTGMLPTESIIHESSIFMPAAPGTLSEINVRYKDSTMEWSTFTFLSYEMGRGVFEGAEYDFAWLDEECSVEIFAETAKRLMTTLGRMILTWTPLDGLTDVVLSFIGEDFRPPEIEEIDIDSLVPALDY